MLSRWSLSFSTCKIKPFQSSVSKTLQLLYQSLILKFQDFFQIFLSQRADIHSLAD